MNIVRPPEPGPLIIFVDADEDVIMKLLGSILNGATTKTPVFAGLHVV